MANHAVVIQERKNAQVVENPIPKLRDDYILVKVHAVGLNPTDWKHVDFVSEKGAIVGCDYAGIVEEVGPKVTNGLKKGQRVAGIVHGSNLSNHEDGAFAEHIVARGDLQIEIPENLSFEEAATLGVGVTTVAQALYQSLGLPLPGSGPSTAPFLLVYGGSTATGSLAIQFAKLSGMTVVTTCSPRNFEYVKSLGAEAAYDYNSPTCAKDIKEYTKGELKLVLDCVCEGDSLQICVEAMNADGGVYTGLLGPPQEKINKINDKIVGKSTLAYTAIGEAFTKFGRETPVVPENYKFACDFWQFAKKLLAEGKVKPHRPLINEGGKGLEGVLKGLQYMREGKVSGQKLVYTLV